MSGIALQLTGQWEVARKVLETSAKRLGQAQHQAVGQEVHALRNLIIQGIDAQAPAGESFAPLAPLTLALRQLRRFGGTKVFITRRSDMRNNINVLSPRPETWFVGIKRGAKATADGEDLVNVAEIQEYGHRAPIVVPVTDKVRRLYLALYISGLVSSPLASTTTVLVYRGTQARPFLQPPFEQWQKGLPDRFKARVAKALNGQMGK